MQQILAFTRKELLIWAQKPGSWIVVFILPILFIAIIQAVFGGSGTPVITVYAVNEDKSAAASQVMEALSSSPNLRIEELKTRDDADQRVGAGQRMAAIIVPEGFGQDLTTPVGAKIEILVDPARSEQANIVNGLVNSALAPITVNAEVSRGVENGISRVMDEITTGTPTETSSTPDTGSALETGTPEGTVTPQTTGTPQGTMTPQPTSTLPAQNQPGTETPAAPAGLETATIGPLQTFFTAGLKGVISSQVEEALADPQVTVNAQPPEGNVGPVARQPSLLDSLVPGYSLMFVFFLIANIASTVIEERENGTLRRLLVAPVPRSRILLGKMIPYFLIAVVQFTVILAISAFIFHIDLGNSILALAIIILASALVMASLGILIAAFSRNEGQASGLSIVLVLVMAVVSGAMFPSITIPGLKAITPHYWAMQGFINVIAQGQGIQGVLLPAGILLTMAAIFFTVGAVRFQFEE